MDTYFLCYSSVSKSQKPGRILSIPNRIFYTDTIHLPLYDMMQGDTSFVSIWNHNIHAFFNIQKNIKKTRGSWTEQVGRDLRTIDPLDHTLIQTDLSSVIDEELKASVAQKTHFLPQRYKICISHTIFRLLWALLGLILAETVMAQWAGACCLPRARFAPGGHGAGSGTPAQLSAQVTSVSFTSGPWGAHEVSHSKSCLWATGKQFVCVTIYLSIHPEALRAQYKSHGLTLAVAILHCWAACLLKAEDNSREKSKTLEGFLHNSFSCLHFSELIRLFGL